MSDSYPHFSTDIAPRDIWQPAIGYQLLSAIQGKTFQTVQNDKHAHIIDIEQQWRLHSSAKDVFEKENMAREHFFEIAQQQRQLQEHLSTQRCLMIIESLEKWRLWQLIKVEQSLFNLLLTALAEGSNKKTAALLLVSMEKFLLATEEFAQSDFYPELTLDTLSLHNNKPIFLGFIPTHKQKTETDLKRAFSSIFAEILELPKEDVREILHYLELYASSHKNNQILLNCLQILLAV